jgi:hypothetical protein
MEAGALTYPGLAAKGTNHISGETPPPGTPGIAGIGRLLSTTIATPGARYYLSFLYRLDREEEYASLVLGTGQGKELAIGKSRNAKQYHIAQCGGAGRVYSDMEAVVGQAAFLAVKMEFREGPDRFTLYVNPMPCKPEPASHTVKEDLDLEDADTLFLYSRAAWSVDEIRLDTTWADVTSAQKGGVK